MKTTERFDAAVLFAAWLHREQRRKHSDTPYIAHLLAVAALVMENGGDEDEAAAALLHDTIEDQGDDFPGGRARLREYIAGRFGARVLEIVDACTDDENHAKGQAASADAERVAWRRRKQAYLDQLRHTSDAGIRRVACADKLHNAWSILADYDRVKDDLWRRFRTGRAEDQIWYMTELAGIFTADTPLERRFRSAALEIARLAPPA